MLTPREIKKTAKELQENYKRLNPIRTEVLSDLQISEDELNRVLTMKNPNPGNVWKVRDYLEDKLLEKGIEIYPFSKLANHSANRWFSYDTPWRNKSQNNGKQN